MADYQQGEVGKKLAFVLQGLGFDVSRAVRIERSESASESQPHRAYMATKVMKDRVKMFIPFVTK